MVSHGVASNSHGVLGVPLVLIRRQINNVVHEHRYEAGWKFNPCLGNTHKYGSNLPVIHPSAAPPWEAQMLCWLAFGEHEALKLSLIHI